MLIKICKFVAIILITSILLNCANIAPIAIEDSDDVLILIMESKKLLQVVENWGFENGFQYVAYRRVGTITTSQWEMMANQYGGMGRSNIVILNNVLVIGINNPEERPENFNITTVPSSPHQELTRGGKIWLGLGLTVAITCFIFGIVSTSE